MPRLIEYMSVGICSSYGDGDYRVSCAVEDLSVEQMKELRGAFVCAMYCAEDMWRKSDKRRIEQGAVQAASIPQELKR